MAFVAEILSLPPHVKRKRVVELYDSLPDTSHAVWLYCDCEVYDEVLSEEEILSNDLYGYHCQGSHCNCNCHRTDRMGILYTAVNYNFPKAQPDENTVLDRLELYVLLTDELSTEREAFERYVLTESNVDGWNDSFANTIMCISGIDSEIANEVLRYILDVVYDVVGVILGKQHDIIFAHAARESYRNLRTLIDYADANDIEDIFNSTLVPSMDNPVSFEFLLTNLYSPDCYFFQSGNYFMSRLLYVDNWNITDMFLNYLRQNDLLPGLREDVRSRVVLTFNWNDFHLTASDLYKIDQLFLQQEYLSVTDVGLDNGDDVRGYPLPTLVLRIAAQETERIIHRKAAYQRSIVQKRKSHRGFIWI